jgi:RNA polymerase sigma-70 factor (ECF subfamily)
MHEPPFKALDRSQDEQRWSDQMARALDGDQEAYAKLMIELAGVIDAFVRARFGTAHASDFVEDSVQEALLALHRVRHSWDRRQPFRPWFFAIVRHKVIDLLRRNEVRRTEAEPVQEPAAPGFDPSQRLDGARLLAGLEPSYREALVLTKLEGCSLEEAAARAGVSVGAMKTRVHRAVRMAQRALRDEELS